MRTRGRKNLGLIGTLLAAGASLVAGCGATKPVGQIQNLRDLRRARTAQSVMKFQKGIQRSGQTALIDYANKKLNDERKDLATLDAAIIERAKAMGLGVDLLNHMRGISGGQYQVPITNSQNSSFTTIYGAATGRTDGQGDIVYGGGLTYEKNGGFFDLSITNGETEASNDSSDITRSWTGTGICAGKYKNFGSWSASAGVGLNWETISTEGYNGNTIVEDEDSKTTPFARLGFKYNKGIFSAGIDVDRTLGKDDLGDYTTTATAKIGIRIK